MQNVKCRYAKIIVRATTYIKYNLFSKDFSPGNANPNVGDVLMLLDPKKYLQKNKNKICTIIISQTKLIKFEHIYWKHSYCVKEMKCSQLSKHLYFVYLSNLIDLTHPTLNKENAAFYRWTLPTTLRPFEKYTFLKHFIAVKRNRDVCAKNLQGAKISDRFWKTTSLWILKSVTFLKV